MKLKDQRILIVGGSSGIGLALARLASQEGANVIIAGRNLEKLKSAQKEIKYSEIMSFDVGIESEVEAALANLGKVRHIITTAANLTYGLITSLTSSAIENMISSKLKGAIYLARYGSKWIEDNGSLLYFSGLAAYRPSIGTSVISTINAGLEGLTKALAIELAPIRVNAISPGVTDTHGWDFLQKDDRAEMFKNIAHALPVKKIGTAEDIAQAAIMLMENSFTTGTVHHVDGGGRLA